MIFSGIPLFVQSLEVSGQVLDMLRIQKLAGRNKAFIVNFFTIEIILVIVKVLEATDWLEEYFSAKTQLTFLIT